MAGLFFLCLYQVLPYALFGLLCGWTDNKKRKTGPFFCASLLTFLVYLLPEIFPGSIAHALYSWPIAIQTADLGGVHLVHFFLLLCNWLLADILVRLYRQEKVLPDFIFLLVLLTGIFIYGQHRIHQFHTLAEEASSADFISITSIQPNIPIKGYEGIELDGPFAGPTGALIKATRQAAEELPDTDLVLWPEVPKSINCACEDFQMQGVTAASVKAQAPILLSCNEFDYGNDTWFDSAKAHLFLASLWSRRQLLCLEEYSLGIEILPIYSPVSRTEQVTVISPTPAQLSSDGLEPAKEVETHSIDTIRIAQDITMNQRKLMFS